MGFDTVRVLAALALVLSCQRADAADPPIVFSEVYTGDAEFFELHNVGDEEVDLSGLRVTGDLAYVFPPKAKIAPQAYVVITHRWDVFGRTFKVPHRQAALHSRLRAAGGELQLVTPVGTVLDRVCYGRARDGTSLQRIRPATPYRGPLNWAPGPPTPGAPRYLELPIPTLLGLDQLSPPPRGVRSSDVVPVSVRLCGDLKAQVTLDWVTRHGRGSTPLTPGERSQDTLTLTASLPPLPDQTLVRYSVTARSADGRVTTLDGSGPWGEALEYFVFDDELQTKLPVYCIDMPGAVFSALIAKKPTRERFAVDVVGLRGGVPEIHARASLQLRGDYTLRWRKRSLGLRLGPAKKEVYLRTPLRDVTYQREVLGYELYRRAGVPAPNAQLVRVQVNGRFFGIYTQVEQVDAAFLSRNGLHGGVLYQAQHLRDSGVREGGKAHENAHDYQVTWSKKTFAREPFTDIREFAESFQRCEPAERQAVFERRLDVDRYVSYLAVTALLSHWDSQVKNFFWCLDRDGSGKWVVIPWDLDATWGDYFIGFGVIVNSPVLLGTQAQIITAGSRNWWNRLRDGFLSVPQFRQRYLARIMELLDEIRPETLDPRIDRTLKTHWKELMEDRRLWGVIRRDDLREAPYGKHHLVREVGLLKHYIRARREFLADACSSTSAQPPRAQPTPPSTAAVGVGREVTGVATLALLALGMALYVAAGGASDARLV